MKRAKWVFLGLVCAVGISNAAADERSNGFRSVWPTHADRIWLGPEYWANRLQDWRVVGGRIECFVSGPDRNVHLLTRRLGKGKGDFQMRVRAGRLDEDGSTGDKTWIGFRLGANTIFGDYRSSVIYGEGRNAGLTCAGRLFIAGEGALKGVEGLARKVPSAVLEDVELEVAAVPEQGGYRVTLLAFDPKEGKRLAGVSRLIPAEGFDGNLVLVCHGWGGRDSSRRPTRFWFKDWQVSGTKVEADDDHVFGPILFNQYTLSRSVLKMTAQMPPIGITDSRSVRLEIRDQEAWRQVGCATIDPVSRTATIRVDAWDDSRDVPYRLVYAMLQGDGSVKDTYYEGTVRKDPVDKDVVVVAGFTGNNDLGFPNEEVIKHLKVHAPDLLVFTGDQIYERVAGYGTERTPVDRACLDYLRKWYVWGWSFGELTRDRPSVCLPDDHDVYHGNVWGAGGRAAKEQDDGGYRMPPVWVRMVDRTQTSHMPDPYDPTVIEQGIDVYYTDMVYGGISFAVIEDRKFKSSPTVMVPEGKVVNGWFQNADFDPATQADVEGAVLLGQRQLDFLRHWAADWRDGVWMKTVISQTIFANVATLPKPATSDKVVPKLRIFEQGEYPLDDVPAADADSDGWPQTGRNRALREMRKGFAFHLAGDQHLGSTIHYGVETWRDAGFAFCVPAVANIWPRRWFPSTPGLNREPGSPKYTGDFLDGFGNRMTVYAVSNPYVSGREPALLYDRATGYGIVKFDRNDRTIRMECWPRYADPGDSSNGSQYPGWPITVRQGDQYGRQAAGYLPTIVVSGMSDPVVQVIDQADGEIVYTLRIKGKRFRPRVFKSGFYTVRVGEPGTERMKTLTDIKPAADDKAVVKVAF